MQNKKDLRMKIISQKLNLRVAEKGNSKSDYNLINNLVD